jgi:hypothetical protein
MALSARHRWCAGKLVEAFAPAVDEARAQVFIRQEENHQRFQALFRGALVTGIDWVGFDCFDLCT